MATQSVTIRLPEPVYEQLRKRAEDARRSVEDELLDVLATALPLDEQLAPDLVAAMGALEALDDAELWRAAESRLAPHEAERFEELCSKQQREGLTDAEPEEAASLARRYERAMLVRGQAAALLRQRGHDVSRLLTAA
jgi:plasmid stability protein